ncbi:MAG: phosphoglycerate dehydrogenase [Spirochaetota bacterium]|nr:MAG: phosphoglycerate dehydrogenase [Spirochaetota bacterium]
MDKILISPRSLTKDGHPSLNLLEEAGYKIVYATPGKQPSEEELLEKLPGCVGYLAGVEKITKKVLEAAKELKVISRNGTGVDNIDLEAAKQLNISIRRTEGANAKGVAELTIALMFDLVRNISFHDAKMKSKRWERKKGIELEGKVLGLVGCGQIGKEITLRVLGLGMKVLAYRRHPDRSFAPSERFSWVSFDELLEQSDIISLHRPAEPSGRPVVTEDVIKKMKKGIYIINTARASLLDESAALIALKDGHIAGIATDVFPKEPPEEFSLVKHERVIATPHLGGYTKESVDRATVGAVENLIDALK